ncbi:nucleotide exchange factor GrpE [Candidatus Saccharibacteria bacterium]|nr:nucleotide exchange factor GrpE [Candidatus Saccharibacteria bacterium]
MKRKETENEVAPETSSEGVDTEKLEARIAELTNDLQRTRADFENYRKQVESQREAAKKMAEFATIYKVLPLLDDMDRAIDTYEELKPLAKSLAKTLKELNLKKIELKEEFDPELAEAVMAEGEGEQEVVSEVLRPGYYYGEEVLRPAMVKVKKM